jgi:GNAT superfamily N-acetyltransferase
VQVRAYEPADREAVQTLGHRLTEGVAPWRDRVQVSDAVTGWVRDSVEHATSDSCTVLVADEGDQVVGFVTVTEKRHWSGETDAYIGELAVAVHAEGCGVGRKLVEAAECWAVGRGHRRITLETGAANHAARSFYASLGYAEEQVQLTRQCDVAVRPSPTSPTDGREEDAGVTQHHERAVDIAEDVAGPIEIQPAAPWTK